MHVILTHEQADFDALAALLGAALLHDQALAVAPRRMNQNARSFLNLYGVDLPFCELRDLPQGHIDLVTLVDTQSMVTLKGSDSSTRVQIIDHHQRRADLPAEWQLILEKTGAATTLLVEEIQETGHALQPIHATLLLLGIYEDTGSMTYAGTTPRDVRAAAFLLEQGADLRTAARFLNPPLSLEQRALYERLLDSTEWHSLAGQNIAVVWSTADDMDQEVSSVAHKIRDLLDPDALFMLVTTSEGVRLVARSTTNRVDVSGVAAHFGGGGHERAAAALIHPENAHNRDPQAMLKEVRDELLRVLPEQIHPAITIGQIMSHKPRMLTPQTSAEEASLLMRRYGYEGYPVVEHSKVIGLLTRRAVDRALAHKLNLPAANLMEAGEVTVTSDQPVEHLQRVMTSSGWGQVPVIDPHSGEVIGIVTRTDLLKTLAGETPATTRLNIAQRLKAALLPARYKLLQLVAAHAADSHVAVYVVGGFVRDLLLERPSLDFDLVTEGDAIGLARRLAREYGGQVTSHSRFGTAKWDISAIKNALVAGFDGSSTQDTLPEDLPDSLDLISARTEFYERPTALPTVERSSIKLDLHRRDFTINTLAIRLDGKHLGSLHDYWGGLADLRRGVVRVMHSLSFIDDPTRLLRAVRFEQRFQFEIEARTRQLMDQARDLLSQVSGDRIRHELNLILIEPRVEHMLDRLEELHLLQAIHPDLPSRIPGNWQSPPPADWNLLNRTGGQSTQLQLAYALWFSGLTPQQARGITARLALSASLRTMILSAIHLAEEIPSIKGLPASQVSSRLDKLPVLSIYAIYQLVDDEALKNTLWMYATRWKWVMPLTTGDTLQALGIKPGPPFRVILENLRNAWLDGSIHSADEEQSLLEELLRQEQNQLMDDNHAPRKTGSSLA